MRYAKGWGQCCRQLVDLADAAVLYLPPCATIIYQQQGSESYLVHAYRYEKDNSWPIEN
jgi:hypothetical protein